MKEVLSLSILVLLLATFVSCSPSQNQGEYIEKSLIWQGKEREYLIYLPGVYNKKEKFPLIIGLHGYTGTATGFEKETTKGMNQHAEAHQYIAVYPQGDHFWGKRDNYPFFVSSWNDIESNAPPRKNERHICSKTRDEYPRPPECKEYSYCGWTSCYDDIGFIKEVIERVSKNYKIDESKRYIVGMSNGGAMAHRFACLHPDLLAAVVSVSGSIPRDRSCVPKSPLAYMQVFGDKDQTVPIDGKLSRDGWYYEKPEVSMSKWADSIGCDKKIVDANLSTAKENNIKCSARKECSVDPSQEVINCLVPDGGHAWPGQIEGMGYCRSKEQESSIPKYSICEEKQDDSLNWGNELIWQFLSKHFSKNG